MTERNYSYEERLELKIDYLQDELELAKDRAWRNGFLFGAFSAVVGYFLSLAI